MRFLSEHDPVSGEVHLVLALHRWERELLLELPRRLEALLLDPNQGGRIADRLFPPTYAKDPEAEAEHRRLIGSSLLEARKEELARFVRTVEAARWARGAVRIALPNERIDLWLRVVNDLRLLYGTDLGVTAGVSWHEPPDDPLRFEVWRAYAWLSMLQGQLLAALGVEDSEDEAPPTEE